MSANTRRVMAEAEATGSKLTLAQKDFSTALDECFGVGQLGGAARFPIANRKAVLSRFVEIDLVGVEQKTRNKARLRFKTVTKNFGDQTATEEDTFPAVKKNGHKMPGAATEPFPCEEQQQTLYRGQVAFDLSEFYCRIGWNTPAQHAATLKS
jgi:hypothetical protein